MNNRERLGSRLGFIMLSAGCAIGCGNVWKFPWMCGQFGLGCEMGISTQKLHARGPMGLEELTSYKYVIRGNGQVR